MFIPKYVKWISIGCAALLALLLALAAFVPPPKNALPSGDAQASDGELANPDALTSDNETDNPDGPTSDGETDNPDGQASDGETGNPDEEASEPEPPPLNILRPDPVSVVSEEAENSPVFGSDVTRKEIATLTFLSTLENIPDGAWDVSEAQNQSVLAWTLKAQPPYDLYLAANGEIVAPSNCEGMFCGYSNLKSLTFGGLFDTSRAVDMSAMFDSCANLAALDVSGFDTSNVTDMQSMFRHCGALESLDVSGFDTANVTDMRSMFRRCASLKALDISGFDMSKVTDVRWMFADCAGLRRFDRNDFDFSRVELHDDYMKNVPMRFSAIPIAGTSGYDEKRDYSAAFDGNPNTKWCLPFSNSAYVEWKMACPGSVDHLYLTSADNHDEYPGRNPGAWRLLGTDRESRRSGVWTVLGEMNPAGFEHHDDVNHLLHATQFSGDPPAFEYYRLEITSTTGAQILQIAEIDMDYR